MSRNILLPLVFLFALFTYSCRRTITLPETVEAHFIQYEINYLENMAGDIPTRILPARMDSWYSEYFVVTKIEGFFNQFSLIQIADLRMKRITTLLNFFGNKVYYRADRGDLPAGIIAPEEMRLKRTGTQKIIGGLNSEQVEVHTAHEIYNIYYTRDFEIRRPNLSTPYGSIDHPLSDFRIQLSHLKMHLSSAKYESRIVDSELFMIPEDYRLVTRPVMEDIINSLFTKD